MISRKRILGFAIGKMLRQDGWAEKYDPDNIHNEIDPCDYNSVEEYHEALMDD